MKRRLSEAVLIRLLMFVGALGPVIVMAGGAGNGIELGRLVARPYVDGSVTYDSNPGLVDHDPEDDYFIEGEVGVGFTYKLSSLDLTGGIFGYRRDYLQEDAAKTAAYPGVASDANGFGESLGASLGRREILRMTLSESYQRVQDYSRQPSLGTIENAVRHESFVAEDRANRVERDVSSLGVALGRDLTDKIELDGALTYSKTDYKFDSLFDSSELAGSVSAGYRVTDKSSAFAAGTYGVQNTDAFSGDDPVSKTIRGGWRTRLTEKSLFNGSLGVEFYDDGTDGIAGRDATQKMISYDIAWLWLPTPKLSLQISGGDSIEPSAYESMNTREVKTIGGAVGYRASPSMLISAGVSYRTDDYRYPTTLSALPGAVGIRRETDTYGAKLGVRYMPPGKWYSLYSAVSYENNDSTIDLEDFDQVRVSIGGRATY